MRRIKEAAETFAHILRFLRKVFLFVKQGKKFRCVRPEQFSFWRWDHRRRGRYRYR